MLVSSGCVSESRPVSKKKGNQHRHRCRSISLEACDPRNPRRKRFPQAQVRYPSQSRPTWCLVLQTASGGGYRSNQQRQNETLPLLKHLHGLDNLICANTFAMRCCGLSPSVIYCKPSHSSHAKCWESREMLGQTSPPRPTMAYNGLHSTQHPPPGKATLRITAPLPLTTQQRVRKSTRPWMIATHSAVVIALPALFQTLPAKAIIRNPRARRSTRLAGLAAWSMIVIVYPRY